MVWTRKTTDTSYPYPVHSVSHCLIQALQDTGNNKHLAQELTWNFGLVNLNPFPSSLKSHSLDTNLWCLFVLIPALLFNWSSQLHLTSVYSLKQSYLNLLYTIAMLRKSLFTLPYAAHSFVKQIKGNIGRQICAKISVGSVPSTNTGCMENGWRAALRRRTGGCLWTRTLT